MRKNKSYNDSLEGQDSRINFASVQDIKSEQSNYGQKEIQCIFEKRFLGSWEETQYKVDRYYLETDHKCINLYVTKLTPKLPVATLIILHGFGEHSGRYMHLADEIAQQDIEVILYDQRGFGQSGGRRGHSTIEEMHIDLECVMKHAERSHPIFLYCHSLGAAVAISFCLANPTLNIQGLIAVNPYIQVVGKYNIIKRTIVHIMNFLIPGLMVNSYIDLAHCSKNNYNIKKVAQDNLISPFLSMQMAYNILQLSSYITPNLQKFVQPLLVIHGKEDKVAHHMNSIELYRHAGSKIKTLKIFDNGFHEPQNDVEFIRLKNYVTIWCKKQIQRDKRISYLKVLNHGIKQGSRTKFILVQLILIYIALKNQINKLGMMAKLISLLSLILASFVVHISW